MNMSDSIKEVLYTEEQLQARVKELGAQITKDYAGKDKILLVSVLRGSYIFMADLPCLIDFMVVSSYGAGTSSSGQVEIKKDISSSIEDYHVIIVEDILDSGNTLYYLLDVLKKRGPKSMKLCTLLDKPDRRVRDVHVDYVGFNIPDEFVVGFGLDYAQKYRNLPYIGSVEM